MTERQLSDAIQVLMSKSYFLENFSLTHNNMKFFLDYDDVPKSGVEAAEYVNYRGGIRVNDLIVFCGKWLIDGPWQNHAENSVKYLTEQADALIAEKKQIAAGLDEKKQRREQEALDKRIAAAAALFD